MGYHGICCGHRTKWGDVMEIRSWVLLFCGQVERNNGNLSMDQRDFSINSEDYVSG